MEVVVTNNWKVNFLVARNKWNKDDDE